jgi:hypothetical protein
MVAADSEARLFLFDFDGASISGFDLPDDGG